MKRPQITYNSRRAKKRKLSSGGVDAFCNSNSKRKTLCNKTSTLYNGEKIDSSSSDADDADDATFSISAEHHEPKRTTNRKKNSSSASMLKKLGEKQQTLSQSWGIRNRRQHNGKAIKQKESTKGVPRRTRGNETRQVSSSSVNIPKPEVNRLIRVLTSESKDEYHFFIPVEHLRLTENARKGMRLANEEMILDDESPRGGVGNGVADQCSHDHASGERLAPQEDSSFALSKLTLPPASLCPSFNNDKFIQFTLPIQGELIGFVKTLEKLVHLHQISFYRRTHRSIMVLSEIQEHVWQKEDLSITVNGSLVLVVDFDNPMLQEASKYAKAGSHSRSVPFLEESLRRYPSNRVALPLVIQAFFQIGSYEKVVDRCNEFLQAKYEDHKDKSLVSKVVSHLFLACQQYNLAEVSNHNTETIELKRCRSVSDTEKDAERQETDTQYFENPVSRDYLARTIVFFKRATQDFGTGKLNSRSHTLVTCLMRFALLFLMFYGRDQHLCPKCLSRVTQDDLVGCGIFSASKLRTGVFPDAEKFMSHFKIFDSCFKSFYQRVQARERQTPSLLKCCKKCHT
uniref:Uncharacterized protein n=1 Tax=Percolomonas cosmopolitus TaxID=63605 RepID=A0A7S1PI42_9EUKA|mmetsp:Transcript_9840/g.36693  ORF Transcript_9840/g.36693 Transcript_9840/m.36693 type:complete len:571 (+) Transcript_9840:58-1770(+)